MEMVNSSRKCLFKKINYFPYLKASKRHCLEGNLHVQWLGSNEKAGCSHLLEREAWAGAGEVGRALNATPRSLALFL